MKRFIAYIKNIARGDISLKMFLYRIHHHFSKSKVNFDDDFNWSNYNIHYKGELEIAKKRYTPAIQSGDYEYNKGKLVKQRDILPIHSNAHLLYETILQLSPETILEVGCGGGDNLHNIKTLHSKFKLSGIDISREQLDFLATRHKSLSNSTKVADITQHDFNYKPVDLVFTQAVIMHIGETEQRHLVALKNIFKTAKKYIVLMENWEKHHFLNDINSLVDSGQTNWEQCFLYYHELESNNATKLIIVSSKETNYKPLVSYDVLLNKQVGE